VKAGDQMIHVLETNRLNLRPFEMGDAEAAFGWVGDLAVMKYVPSGPDRSLEDTRRRIALYQEHQARHGFSKWVIIERGSGRAIGDSGLLVLEDEGWIDLGFRLAPAYWGQGFATEAASAWIRAAFSHLGIQSLGAFTHPGNVASVRVLEKLGFQAIRRDTVMGKLTHCPGHPHPLQDAKAQSARHRQT
jgi:ribosomal-protein-alanine N-acetyltransferase